MSILTEADALINGERQADYGPPSENLRRIAGQWTLYLQQKYGVFLQITPEDVCWMMADLKKCRQMHQPKHDTVLDAAGYLGLIEKVTV